MAEPENRLSKEARTAMAMARKLAVDVAAIERRALAPPPETFRHYKQLRMTYLEILGLIVSIQERIPRIGREAPPDFGQWVVRMKLRALTAFTSLSLAFLENPPVAITQAIGARDVLLAERENFTEVLGFFDGMLFEAGIDDKTADALDATRTSIERILARLDLLLVHSPEALPEF
jgi:hypothetical protein